MGRTYVAAVTAGGGWEIFEALGARPSMARCLAAGSEVGVGVVPGKDWRPVDFRPVEWVAGDIPMGAEWCAQIAGSVVYALLRDRGESPADASRPARAAHQHDWLSGPGVFRVIREKDLEGAMARWSELGQWLQGVLPMEEPA